MSVFNYSPIYNANLIRVVDGDTLDVEVDLGFKVYAKIRLRLLYVDTPEIYGVKASSAEYEQGVEASKFTKNWIETNCQDGELTIRTAKGLGKYGRWLAEVWPRDADLTVKGTLNEALREKGWGVPNDTTL